MTTAQQSAFEVMREALKIAKRDLMHQRRFGADTLNNWRNVASSVEGDIEEALAQAKQALAEPQAQVDAPMLMDTAPKNGTMVRLLVEFEENSLEDSSEPVWTIGANYSDVTMEDNPWQFAGWNWSHDCFTEGHGKPIGWLPMLGATPPASAQAGYKLVPVEPTQEMLDAVVTTLDDSLLGPDAEKQYRADWAAMLAAAPEAT